MAFAEKDAVVAELFGALGAHMNLADGLYAAVDAVQAEFHLKEALGISNSKKWVVTTKITMLGQGSPCPNESYGWKATSPQPVAQGTTGS